MRRLMGVMLAVGMVACGACAAGAESATATLAPTTETGSTRGTVALTDTPAGLEVRVAVTGAPPGAHGLHIHQFGGCGEHGGAAGGHYNPAQAAHGFLPDQGLAAAHPGDMGNLEVNSDGVGILELVLPGVSLSGASPSVAGRAVIVHADPDDFSQPTGNAGGRIACGPILLSGAAGR